MAQSGLDLKVRPAPARCGPDLVKKRKRPMEASLQELVDHHEIKKLLNIYCQGSDRLDADRMASVFHSDSWVDHAADHCPGREFVEVTMAAELAYTSMVSHLMGQSHIEVKGEGAVSETYFIAVLRGPGEAGAKLLTFMGGRYVDSFAKEAGRWKIQKRVCVRDWSYSQVVEQDFLETQPFIPGSWSGEDPFYTMFGLKHAGSKLSSS
jgi:hypothetical protein